VWGTRLTLGEAHGIGDGKIPKSAGISVEVMKVLVSQENEFRKREKKSGKHSEKTLAKTSVYREISVIWNRSVVDQQQNHVYCPQPKKERLESRAF